MGPHPAGEEALKDLLTIHDAIRWTLMGVGMAGIVAVATGLTLLLLPRRLLVEPSPVRRVLFETSLGVPFNRRFAIERHVYRRHAEIGALVLGGAMAALGLAWYLASGGSAAALFGPVAARLATLALATLATVLAVVGSCLVLRPSVLKGVEAVANRWIEPLPPSNLHMVVSRVLLSCPRIAGLALVAAGAACLRLFL